MSEEGLLWTQPGWTAEVQAWIAAEAPRAGCHWMGPAAQEYIRPWSTVMRVPCAGETLFFKPVCRCWRARRA